MNELQKVFNFEGKEVRTIIKKEEAWFVAKDICEVLGLNDVSKAISRLDDDEKGTNNIPTLGGTQSMLVVNESGLYNLIFTSRKDEAKKFKKWVTNEVLPTIRKTGGYISNTDMMVNTYFGSLPEEQKTLVKGLFTNIEEQQRRLRQQSPKVEAYNKFIDADGLYSMANFAKHIGIGRNNLLKALRDNDILQGGGFNHNIPYQTFINRGYFKVKTKTTPIGNKSVTLVTPKGADWLAKKLDEIERVAS